MTADRVIVTGATGFVGSHLCRRLISGDSEVHVIVRRGSNLSQLKDIRSKLTIHNHDGSTASMIEILRTCKPKVVFHLASLFIAHHNSASWVPNVILELIRSSTSAEL